jgi:2,4-dienoyl-CoA reductase-like NADH-dependent reductase (Old Yellow Enzyme family)
MSSKHFPHLFSEGQIGNFDIKNRIVMLPMARQFQAVYFLPDIRFIRRHH